MEKGGRVPHKAFHLSPLFLTELKTIKGGGGATKDNDINILWLQRVSFTAQLWGEKNQNIIRLEFHLDVFKLVQNLQIYPRNLLGSE